MFLKKGNSKMSDEYYMQGNNKEINKYKYNYKDFQEKIKPKTIYKTTFSQWINDLELKERGYAIKKGNPKITWYVDEIGLNILLEHSNGRNIGYKKRPKMRKTFDETYKCEVDVELVKKIGIKNIKELNMLLNKLLDDYFTEIEQNKQIELTNEIKLKEKELANLIKTLNELKGEKNGNNK